MSNPVQGAGVVVCTMLVVALLLAPARPSPVIAAGVTTLAQTEDEPAPAPAPTIAIEAPAEDVEDAPVDEPAPEPAPESAPESAPIKEQIVEIYVTIPVTETVFVEEIVPVTETVYVEEIVPVTETVYVEQIVPITETVIVTEVIEVEQIVPVTETVCVTETVQVNEIVPVTHTVHVTETVRVEQVIPVTQTVVVTEVVSQVVPVTETVWVTETAWLTHTTFVTETVEQIVPIKEVVRVTQTVRVGPPVPTEAPAISDTVPASSTQGLVPHLPVVASWTSLRPTYWEQTPLPVSGTAMFYNPWVMDGVLRYRLAAGNVDECVECVGYIALLRAGDINRRVWIQFLDGTYEGPFQVTDVAARGDIPNLTHRGWVVDVDWTTAARWGMQGGVPVTILDAPPVLIQ